MNQEPEQRWWEFRGALRERGLTVKGFAALCERSPMQVRRVVMDGERSPAIEPKLAEVLGEDNPLAGRGNGAEG